MKQIVFTFALLAYISCLAVPVNDKQRAQFFEAIKKQTQDGKLFGEELVGSESDAGPIPVPMTSGYIPIDTDDISTSKNLTFFMYFPSRNDPKKDPLVLWFTGGPGCSSELAIAVENGPFEIVYDNTAKKIVARERKYSWNNNANLLFVDNPFGVGFSILGKGEPPVTTEMQVSSYVEIFLMKWLKDDRFKDLQGRELYITGESYGGHYVPAISHKLHLNRDPMINFQGCAIGNGLSSPNYQYPEYITFSALKENLPYTLLSPSDIQDLQTITDLCNQMIWNRNPRLSVDYTAICSIPVGAILAPTPEQKKEGFPQRFNTYNIKEPCKIPGLCYDFSNQTKFFNSKVVQEQLGVADRNITWESCSSFAGSGLARADWWLPAMQYLIPILEGGKRVLVYSGDLDFICNWKGGESWTLNLEWSGQSMFAQQPLKKIEEGYGESRKWQNFEFLRFYQAGHMVPLDQPKECLMMLNKFIGQPMPK